LGNKQQGLPAFRRDLSGQGRQVRNHRARHAPPSRRNGGVSLLVTLFGRFPFLGKLFADSAYQEPVVAQATAKILLRLEIEIVKRSDQAKGFVTLPMRWMVARSIAWLNSCRRLAKDWETFGSDGR
jgi:hypothetical protein